MATIPSVSRQTEISASTTPECPESKPLLDEQGVPINSEFLTYPSEDEMCQIFGVSTPIAAHGLVSLAFAGLGNKGKYHRPFMLATAIEFAPQDAIEAMLITQISLAHLQSMSATGRMSDALDEQSCEANSRIMSRMSKVVIAQMDTLQRHRSGSQTNISISQVTVEQGGQAIVGSVHAKAPRNET